MALLNARELLAFPVGSNASDTLIGGAHFNLTTLNHWNFTYYSNNTLSNGSNCYLAFKPYTPALLLDNGTFVNSTTCYSAINPIGTRSKLGIGFAAFFVISIMFTLINLRKHGRLFLPAEKRFRPIGRRWQWYWMLVVGALGIVANLTNIDVDRYYLPELPLVLTSFFWFLCLPATLAVVWESVRHWGSWQERQMIDPDPFSIRQDDRRSKVELMIPLVFYLFFWLNFFMVIPQSWTNIEKQRNPEQASLIAEPTATNIRFKMGAFFLFGAWLTIVFSLRQSIHHYRPRHRGSLNRVTGAIRYAPLKLMLMIVLSLVLIGYDAACAFDFSISPLKLQPDLGLAYGLGWGPIILILVVNEVAGYANPNEDRELSRQRRVRDVDIDREMGITKKPSWWSRSHGEIMNVQNQIARNVLEIGGVAAPASNGVSAVNMGSLADTSRTDQQSMRSASRLLHRQTSGRTPNPSSNDVWRREQGSLNERSNSANSETSIAVSSQTIRSMLDV